MTLKLLDLFSGIGGFSLAAHQLGWETVAFVEKEPFCQRVLTERFEGVPIHDDIFTFSGKPFRGRVDIIAGGPPCQPFSAAGKRKGVNDERYLFPETLRIVREVQPTWFILENVAGLISMANETWETKVGSRTDRFGPDIDHYEAIYTRKEILLLGVICDEIERYGYAVQPVVIPASAIGAWHERKRIWIVARSKSVKHPEHNGLAAGAIARSDAAADGEQSSGTHPATDVAGTDRNAPDPANPLSSRRIRLETDDAGPGGRREYIGRGSDGIDGSRNAPDAQGLESRPGLREAGTLENGHQPGNGGRDVSDTQDERLQGMWRERNGQGSAGLQRREDPDWNQNWLEAATQLCRADDGLPDWLDPSEKDTIIRAIEVFGREEVERRTGIDCSQASHQIDRIARLKALGNSIVPQIAAEIFKAIEASETVK